MQYISGKLTSSLQSS